MYHDPRSILGGRHNVSGVVYVLEVAKDMIDTFGDDHAHSGALQERIL